MVDKIEIADEPKVEVEIVKKPAVRVINEWKRTDKWTVAKEIQDMFPGMHFLWARKDEDRVSILEGDGYEIVRVPEKLRKRPRIKSKLGNDSMDDTITRGGNILMMVEQSYVDGKNKSKESFIRARTLSAKSNMEDQASRVSGEIGRDIPTHSRIISSTGT